MQQDLALGALIGVTHAERNGHHYVDGLAKRRPRKRKRSSPRIPISIPAMEKTSGCRSTMAIS